MMNDAEAVISDFYNTLEQLRYTCITTTTLQNMESTILNGDNRISLLTWILTEKSPTIGATLQNLRGISLEEKLIKYYSSIGICTNKDILLGNCSLEKQLPTLKLLLKFMKGMKAFNAVHVEDKEIEGQTITDIVKRHTTQCKNIVPHCKVNSNLNYHEAQKYFENIKKHLNEDDFLNSEVASTLNTHTNKENNKNEKRYQDSNVDLETFTTEKDTFLETFASIPPRPISSPNFVNDSSNCMDTNIKNMYSDFLTFKQILQTKDEISRIVIPKGVHETCTSLSAIFEDIVVHIEEIKNVYDNIK